MKTITSTLERLKALLLALSVSALLSACAADKNNLLTLEIPNKIGPLVVGKSNYADVVTFFGEPELAENTKTEYGKQEILNLSYPRKGIEFTVDKNKQMRVVRIEVYRPYQGSSIEGVRLGMPFAEAKKIISSRFGKPATEFEDYIDWEIPNTFALKHERGVVIAIKMLGE